MVALRHIMTVLFRHVPSFRQHISTDVSPSPKRTSPEICNMSALRLFDIGQNPSELGLTWFAFVQIGMKYGPATDNECTTLSAFSVVATLL